MGSWKKGGFLVLCMWVGLEGLTRGGGGGYEKITNFLKC